MKKVINIFIDYVGTDQDEEFAKKLVDRLKIIKGDFSVTCYTDLVTENSDPASWESKTLDAIKAAKIVIPILSPEYLSFVSPKIEEKFDQIIDSIDKFLFPIYFRPSDWSSFNWVVKAKLIPSDNYPISEYSDNDLDRILNVFVKNVGNIINSESGKPRLKEEAFTEPAESVVFISHDHEDADFAELLKLTLEKSGLSGWIDSERLKIGQDWREEIDEGIKNSAAVIVVMTPDARKSEYVTYEWAFAWGKEKKIFPLMLKQTQLHPRLESLQYLDFTNRSSRPWEKLIDSLKNL